MKQIGPGILPQSEIYFSSPSQKAKKLYYNVLCAGHFYCDKNYRLVRESYDSVLILHVLDGSFTFVDSNKKHITAAKNDTVILDCYKPHEYYADGSLESIWIHVTGANSREFLKDILKDVGNIIKSKEPGHIKNLMQKIFKGISAANPISESELSLTVYKLLLEFLNPAPAKAKDETVHEDNMQYIRDYISAHLNEKITVKDLSEKVHMSATHFSRVFRHRTGFSPYGYVLASRLNKAKELLLKTDLSVTEIAYETGFNSEANFVYFFTNNEGISPGKFRKLNF